MISVCCGVKKRPPVIRRFSENRFRVRRLVLFLASVAVLLTGCALFERPPERIDGSALQRLPIFRYPAFFDDMDYDGLAQGISESLIYLRRLPPERAFWFADDRFSVDHLVCSLEVFEAFVAAKPTPEALNQFIENHFWVYRSRGSEETGDVLFTGYYEPFLEGSLRSSATFPYPVYTRPKDLAVIDLAAFGIDTLDRQTLVGRITADQTVVPYYDRQEIVATPLTEQATPIAWVNDRIDLFFLQIQGSGRIYLDTGGFIRVHYHASNGHPYKSIGALLIDEKKIPREEMSMQRLRAYLKAHPEEVDEILNYNPSYVFFKPEPDGPFGCYGVKVTPGRSLALQKRIFPAAALTFMITEKPLVDSAGQVVTWHRLRRFGLNQDTGGAIRGPGRADLFWGHGPYAEVAAGHMQHPGELYFLVLRPDTPLCPQNTLPVHAVQLDSSG